MLSWELKCPHCGGPNEVAADRGCLPCQFCGAGLWVKLPAGFTTLVARPRIAKHEAVFSWDRYLKKHDRPLSRSHREARRVYLPFWRVSAIIAVPRLIRRRKYVPEPDFPSMETSAAMRMFQSEDNAIEECEWDIKPWDMTVPAFEENRWGMASLGIRVETVPLAGWDRVELEEDDACWPVTVGESAAFDRIHRTVGSLIHQGANKVMGDCQLITPKLSLVYWPVWVIDDVVERRASHIEVDAVSGRVIREAKADPSIEFNRSTLQTGTAPELLPHRCLSCGQDLPVDDRYVVFSCTNCQALIAHDSTGHRQTITVEFAQAERPETHTWYPFWSFAGGHLLIPGFAIRNYRLLVRFGEIMSGQERGFSPGDDIMRRKGVIGVTLPSDTAAGFAEVVRRRNQWQGIFTQSVPPESLDFSQPPELVYASLDMTGTEIVDPVTGLCMSRSAVSTL